MNTQDHWNRAHTAQIHPHALGWKDVHIPGTVSTVQDTWVGSFIIVKEVLSLFCDTALLKHGIWYVIICWLHCKYETRLNEEKHRKGLVRVCRHKNWSGQKMGSQILLSYLNKADEQVVRFCCPPASRRFGNMRLKKSCWSIDLDTGNENQKMSHIWVNRPSLTYLHQETKHCLIKAWRLESLVM